MTRILRNIVSSSTIPAFVHAGLMAVLKSSVFEFALGFGYAGLGVRPQEMRQEVPHLVSVFGFIDSIILPAQ